MDRSEGMNNAYVTCISFIAPAILLRSQLRMTYNMEPVVYSLHAVIFGRDANYSTMNQRQENFINASIEHIGPKLEDP